MVQASADQMYDKSDTWWINHWFVRQRAFIETWSYEARGKFGEHASFLSALQMSQVFHISMNAQLTYEPIVLFYNIFNPMENCFSRGICLWRHERAQ